MNRIGLVLALVSGLLGGVALHHSVAPARAQPAPAPAHAALFSITIAGQPTITDTVKAVLVEHDKAQAWDLLVTGSKGKGQYTCEVRSTDKGLLFGLQRAITDNEDIVVNCANASKSPRGGALVDLDSDTGGSLVVTITR